MSPLLRPGSAEGREQTALRGTWPERLRIRIPTSCSILLAGHLSIPCRCPHHPLGGKTRVWAAWRWLKYAGPLPSHQPAFFGSDSEQTCPEREDRYVPTHTQRQKDRGGDQRDTHSQAWRYTEAPNALRKEATCTCPQGTSIFQLPRPWPALHPGS